MTASRRRNARIVIALGLVVALGSLLVDVIGLSHTPRRFGYFQLAGLVAGVLAAVEGLVLHLGYRVISIDGHIAVLGAAIERVRNLTARNFITLALSTLIALFLAEGAIRLVGETDENGQFYFRDIPLRPYALPVASVEKILVQYEASDSSYLMYDPYLGWTIRPDSESQNGLYQSNAAGLRAGEDYSPTPHPEVVRILIFGDSFTHGDDVALSESWGYRLQELLAKEDMRVEVLNFGVGGYGIDQAYLRWQQVGRDYSPDIVLFGFQPEMSYRNMNIFRPFYFPASEVPFFKPRFLLDGGQLRLVNSPTPVPEDIPEVIVHFDESPLAEHEYFMDARDYTRHWWYESRLVALVLDVSRGRGTEAALDTPEIFALDAEPARLDIAILEAFEDDVHRHGAEFAIVHLPREVDLLRMYRSGAPAYADLLQYLDEHFTVIHTEYGFEASQMHSYYQFGVHYSADGNEVVAEAVAAQVLDVRVGEPK